VAHSGAVYFLHKGKVAGFKFCRGHHRFWETEFSSLGPKKSGKGHRLYRRKDVETLLQIRRLLHEQRFTIAGARKHLKTLPREDRRQLEMPLDDRRYRNMLVRLKKDLESLHRMLR